MTRKKTQSIKRDKFKVPLVIHQGGNSHAPGMTLPLLDGLVLLDLSKGIGFIKPQQEYEITIKRVERAAADKP
jgi:hypothetical protein